MWVGEAEVDGAGPMGTRKGKLGIDPLGVEEGEARGLGLGRSKGRIPSPLSRRGVWKGRLLHSACCNRQQLGTGVLGPQRKTQGKLSGETEEGVWHRRCQS